MSKRYFCNLSTCLKLMINPGYRKSVSTIMRKKTEKYIVFEEDIKKIYLEFIESAEGDYLNLVEKINEYVNKQKEKIGDRKQKFTEKQSDLLLGYLNEVKDIEEGINESDLTNKLNISRAVLNRMVENGVFKNEEREAQIFGYNLEEKLSDIQRSGDKVLSDEQQNAFDEIKRSIDSAKFEEILLHGVTGSGKTEIYIQSIKYVLSLGKKAIVLVPEIALTPQMIYRFSSRFDEKIGVLHSGLTEREKFEEWERIERGDIKIVIGTRSAIFTPVSNLGIIIIDEEHDRSYKSETTPRYDAKEIARFFAKTYEIPLILGSATPLVSTYYKAQKGEAKLITLKKRATNAPLPKVEIVDLRDGRKLISDELKSELIKNKENGKQSIIFLNKRGYSRMLICEDCGKSVLCKNCNVNLRYHKKENKLKCHYCGYEKVLIKKCPNCNGNLKLIGVGLQQIEERLKQEIPNLTIIRLDADNLKEYKNHEKILKKFKEEKIDVLLGTEMVTKGHDFPDVSLSCVLLADQLLNEHTYRATEEAFQTLVQIIGRAGRKEQGTALVQTYNPDHYILELAKKQDYVSFYKAEVGLREMLKYPPFTDIILISSVAKTEKKAESELQKIYQVLEYTKIDKGIKIYEPQPYVINKVKKRYRWKMVVKANLDNRVSYWINKAIDYIGKKQDVDIYVELNPLDM